MKKGLNLFKSAKVVTLILSLKSEKFFIQNKRKMNYYLSDFANFSTKSREIKEIILPYLNLFELQNKLFFCEDIYSRGDGESTPEKKVLSPCGSISNKLSLSVFLEWKVFLLGGGIVNHF